MPPLQLPTFNTRAEIVALTVWHHMKALINGRGSKVALLQTQEETTSYAFLMHINVGSAQAYLTDFSLVVFYNSE